jgi:heat shock protein HslJ
MDDRRIAPGTDGEPDAPPLAGRTFVSTSAFGRPLVPGSTVRITFREGGLAATAGCNTLFGSAGWTEGVLAAPTLASTMMACAPELMAQDEWLAVLLQSRPAIELDGRTLTIGDGSTGLLLVEAET